MTINWGNLVTCHPETGAYRNLSPDLLAEAYLAPCPPDFDWSATIDAKTTPWAESLIVAPREVQAAIERALCALLSATRDTQLDGIDVTTLPEGRARRHLTALLDLVHANDGLPHDYAIIQHVLSGAISLETLTMCPPPARGFDCLLEETLHTVLTETHGCARPRAEFSSYNGAIGTVLRAVQEGFLKTDVPPVACDDSLNFYSVRDASEEADLAAGIARRLIDDGAKPQDIAVLVPDFRYCVDFLTARFATAGIPLGGAPETAVEDVAKRALWLILQCMQDPTPRMAIASLCILPGAPWDSIEGHAMARALMQYGHSDQLPEWLREGMASEPKSLKALCARLRAIAKHWPQISPEIGSVVALSASIQEDASVPWQQVLDLARPYQDAPELGPRFVEAASLWLGDREPWRPARHLIVAGFHAGSYPRGAVVGPLFLDSELRQINDLCSLQMPTRATQLLGNLENFSRQLGAVSESITFIEPSRDLAGKAMGQSEALALIARLLDTNGVPLVQELRTLPSAGWPVPARTLPQNPTLVPSFPQDGQLRIGRDLLRVRKDENGVMKPQSPSRLETMLVSPLVWLINEAGAKEIIWLPDGMDILVQGTLYHAVLEDLFPTGTTGSNPERVKAEFSTVFKNAVQKEARFLTDQLWRIELANHRTEIHKMALEWDRRLGELDATVLGNEIHLAGDALGLRLNGFADTVLALPSGETLVVDFKTSKSQNRRKRMQAGWDIQVALYRYMIAEPSNEETKALQPAHQVPAIAYHLLRDGVTLSSGASGAGLEDLGSGIADNAMVRLAEIIAELGHGFVRLNSTSDLEFHRKETGIAPYALTENTLGAAFIMPDPDV